MQVRCSLKSTNKERLLVVCSIQNNVLAEHLEFHINTHPGLYHNIKNHARDRVSAITSGAPEPGACFYTESIVGGDYLRG